MGLVRSFKLVSKQLFEQQLTDVLGGATYRHLAATYTYIEYDQIAPLCQLLCRLSDTLCQEQLRR